MTILDNLNPDNAFIAGSDFDALWLAPVGTPLPTGDEELDPAFVHAGWIHQDGITESLLGSKSELRGHQGQRVVRQIMDTPGTQYSITLLEDTRLTNSIRYDEVSSTVSNGLRTTVRTPGQKISSFAAVLEVHDRGIESRWVRHTYSQLDITPNGERVFVGSDIAAFPILADVIGNYQAITPESTVVESPAEPVLTSVAPVSGAAGVEVTLTGQNLSGATAVRFGSATSNFTVISNTEIKAIVPTGAAGSAPVKVWKNLLDSDAVAFERL